MQVSNIRKIVRSIFLWVGAAAMLSACDSTSSDVTGSNPITGDASGFRISGHLYTTGSQVSGSTRVCVEGVCALPDASGAFTITGTAKAVAGRVAGDTLTHAYIVIGTDTLREIPVISWSEVLPANYVVQRNVSVTPNTEYRGTRMQAVYFGTDSIAKVVTLAATNFGKTFTGYIYSVYDSAAYANNSPIYSWFARAKLGDSTICYTRAMPVTGLNGDLIVDSIAGDGSRSFIQYSEYFRFGYAMVPNDSCVSNYMEYTHFDSLLDMAQIFAAQGMYFHFETAAVVRDPVTGVFGVDTLNFTTFPDTLRFLNGGNMITLPLNKTVDVPPLCSVFMLYYTDSTGFKHRDTVSVGRKFSYAMFKEHVLHGSNGITYATNIHFYARVKI